MRRKIQKIIRFSEEERNDVERRAKAVGMKPSAFVRCIASNGQIKSYDLFKYQNLVFLMRGIWNEMNQIAKLANSKGKIVEKDIEGFRPEINQLKMFL